MDDDFYTEEDDVELGYEIDGDGSGEPTTSTDRGLPPSNRVLRRMIIGYVLSTAVIVAILAIAIHSHLMEIERSARLVDLAHCQAQASAAVNSQVICEQGRLMTERARLEEVNVTSECWERLEVCQDQAFELAGLNVTTSNLKRDREKLLKELEETRKRLEKIQEGLG